MVTLLYQTLRLTLRYDMVIQRTRVMAAFEIAAKPLQIETWLLLTAYRKSPLFYPARERVYGAGGLTFRRSEKPTACRGSWTVQAKGWSGD